MNHEDKTIIAIFSPNMGTAVRAINELACGHLLIQMLHVRNSDVNQHLWLIFKNDSWLRDAWHKRWPGCEIVEGKT